MKTWLFPVSWPFSVEAQSAVACVLDGLKSEFCLAVFYSRALFPPKTWVDYDFFPLSSPMRIHGRAGWIWWR